jgi:hypothetical protein
MLKNTLTKQYFYVNILRLKAKDHKKLWTICLTRRPLLTLAGEQIYKTKTK